MMPSIYRNTGAAWTRPDGTVIGRGMEFQPTPDEFLRRAYKLEYVRPADDHPSGLKDRGGGWFELPDGRKVQGEDAALELLAQGAPAPADEDPEEEGAD